MVSKLEMVILTFDFFNFSSSHTFKNTFRDIQFQMTNQDTQNFQLLKNAIIFGNMDISFEHSCS